MILTRRKVLSIGCGFGASKWLAHSGFGQIPAATSASFHPLDDPLAYVNPEFKPTLTQVLKTMPAQQELNAATLPQLRAITAGYARPVLPSPAVQVNSLDD